MWKLLTSAAAGIARRLQGLVDRALELAALYDEEKIRLQEQRERVYQSVTKADYFEQAGDYQAALGCVEKAVERLRELSKPGAGGDYTTREHQRMWELLFRRAALLDALDLYEPALQALDDLLSYQAERAAAGCPAGNMEMARIKGRRSLLYRELQQYDAALRESEEAYDFASQPAGLVLRKPGEDSEIAYYLVIQGMILYDLKRWEEARAVFGDALARLRRSHEQGAASLETQTITALFLSSILNIQHRSAEAIMHSSFALQLVQNEEGWPGLSPDLVSGLLYQRALALQRSQRWKEAMEDINSARGLKNQ